MMIYQVWPNCPKCGKSATTITATGYHCAACDHYFNPYSKPVTYSNKTEPLKKTGGQP